MIKFNISIKLILTLIITFSIINPSYATIVPKPGCVNLKNSTWTGEAVLTPIWVPGPKVILPVKIIINDVEKHDLPPSKEVLYNIGGAINGGSLAESSSDCVDRAIDSVITWLTFYSGKNVIFNVLAQSPPSTDPQTLTVLESMFIFYSADGNAYENKDGPVILTKQ